jgi:hypothetical protein
MCYRTLSLVYDPVITLQLDFQVDRRPLLTDALVSSKNAAGRRPRGETGSANADFTESFTIRGAALEICAFRKALQ